MLVLAGRTGRPANKQKLCNLAQLASCSCLCHGTSQHPRQDFEDSKSTTVADLGLDPVDVAEADAMAEGAC